MFVGERALRHCLDHQAEREVALGLLRFRRIEAAERGAETAHVVVADAHQRQVGQGAVGDVLIELTLPLVVAPQVGVVLVVAAEVDVGERASDGSSGATWMIPAWNGSLTGDAIVPMLPMLFTRKP